MSNRVAEQFVQSYGNILRAAVIYNFHHQNLNNANLLEFLSKFAYVERLHRLKKCIIVMLTSRGQAKKLVHKLDRYTDQAIGFTFRAELLVASNNGNYDLKNTQNIALQTIHKADSFKVVLPVKESGENPSCTHPTPNSTSVTSSNITPSIGSVISITPEIESHMIERKDLENKVVVLAILGCASDAEYVTSYCNRFIEELIKSLPDNLGPIRLIRLMQDPVSLRRLNSILLAEAYRFCVVITKNNTSTRTCSVFSLLEGTSDKEMEHVSAIHAIEKLSTALKMPAYSIATGVNQLVELDILIHKNGLLLLLYDCFSTYISIDLIEFPREDILLVPNQLGPNLTNHIIAFLYVS
ncbi:hypothetical protein Ciccas_004012 [Cichlidogyrus casuarinus]|uniref:Uncharacterized protein n=1 Tax=Cichlidogyrus casuarinus TaxID=1844966 RepID=A0ABD2QCQ2_9PLAT